ncbi:eukaryotic translation initiation factor 3 subunit J [Geranomyces variabilis]|nr:eukaryotic translation initiation factor 3 subunit J [Geranomyces variabilis]
MSDWENEDQEIALPVAAAVVTTGAWDDEDVEEEEVKSSWEDSDDAAEKPAAPAKPVAPPKKKQTLAQKLKQKEEEERLAAEKAAEEAENDKYADETPEERKERLAQAVIDSDMQNARNLFGVSGGGSSKLETLNPTTRPEFDEYVSECLSTFSKFESKTQYPYFVEALVRGLLVAVNVDETRRISSSISAIINEKQKAAKAAVSGKKKPKKAMLGKVSGGIDTANYDGKGSAARNMRII